MSDNEHERADRIAGVQRGITRLTRATSLLAELVYRAAGSVAADEHTEALLIAYTDLRKINADIDRVRVILRAPYPDLDNADQMHWTPPDDSPAELERNPK